MRASMPKRYLLFWMLAPLGVMLVTINAQRSISSTCEKIILLSQSSTNSDLKLYAKDNETEKQYNSKAIQTAADMAVAALVTEPDTCRVVIKIAEGSWYFSKRENTFAIFVIPDMRDVPIEKSLVFSGFGADKTHIIVDQNTTFVRNKDFIRNVSFVDFDWAQDVPATIEIGTERYRYGLKTTQGTVKAVGSTWIDVVIDEGFPDPRALDSELRQECIASSTVECEDRFIKRFARDSLKSRPYFLFKADKKIPLHQYPRYNNYRISYSTVTKRVEDGVTIFTVELDNDTDGKVFMPDDLVAFKSKHGGLLLYNLNCSGNKYTAERCHGLTFKNLKFTHEARGVVDKVDFVSVINNNIQPAGSINGIFPVMATSAGGFQINKGRGHVIKNNFFKGLGDDGVGFFEIGGGPDSTVIEGNHIEDSWNRGLFLSSTKEACSETIKQENCTLLRGCAIENANKQKIEFKQFLFLNTAPGYFNRTYISYSNEDYSCNGAE